MRIFGGLSVQVSAFFGYSAVEYADFPYTGGPVCGFSGDSSPEYPHFSGTQWSGMRIFRTPGGQYADFRGTWRPKPPRGLPFTNLAF
jgi:hypothetical protein